MTRHERAIERAEAARSSQFQSGDMYARGYVAGIDAYEAELAADLESDETMDRLVQEFWPLIPMTNGEIIYARDQMCAALRSVLKE